RRETAAAIKHDDSNDWDVRLAVLGHLLPLDANLKVSVQRLPLQWWLTLSQSSRPALRTAAVRCSNWPGPHPSCRLGHVASSGWFRSSLANVLPRVRLARPVAPTRRVRAHLFAEIREIVHGLFIENCRHGRNPFAWHCHDRH